MVIIFSVGFFVVSVIASFWIMLPLPKTLTFSLPQTEVKGGSSSNMVFLW